MQESQSAAGVRSSATLSLMLLASAAAAQAAVPAVPAVAPVAAPAPVAPAAPIAPDEAGSADVADAADVQARLDAARERLEQAAQEVASLSLKLGGEERIRMLIDTGAGPSARPRPMLGLQLDPAGGRGGARVAAVSPGGPAAQAGVRAGDVVVALGGRDLGQDADPGRALVQAMRDAPAGKPLKLRLLRAGTPLELSVTPRVVPLPALPPLPPAPPRRPGDPAMAAMLGRGPGGTPILPPPGSERMLLQLHAVIGGIGGMELATLSPQLGRYFGADQGVLVVRAPGDAAWKLEDGDVITAIDGRTPNSGAHATRILASYQPGETVSLRLLRQRKPLTLQIVMPAARG